jgi:ring-1,2-phenylacetyl-CoA epoxidase subunit PaaE
MKTYTLKVLEVRNETDDTITISFKQPGLKKIKYLAGQYLTLQIRINGRRYIRPYSFSSSPSVDSTIDVTVKRVFGGIVSNYLNDNIKGDDVIEVLEPLGDFTCQLNTELKSVVFWGVGSGITPLYSIIKQLLVEDSLISIYLIYGNKSNSTVIFRDQLVKLKEKYSGRFKIYHFYSNEEFFDDEDIHNYHGRINSGFVTSLIQNIEIPTRHFICGPVGFKNMIEESLLSIHPKEDNVFSEEFELVKNPKDFEDIETHTVNIKFQGKEIPVEVEKGKSVLEAALDVGIELPYSCQTGNCSTCKAKLKVGALRMIGLTKGRDDLEKDDYLLCCSYPLTDDVYLEI